MTGRRLYEIVTDEAFASEAYETRWFETNGAKGEVVSGLFTGTTPASWAYLPHRERVLWNRAARRITKGRRS